MPRKDVCRIDPLKCAERESSLLLDADVLRGNRSPFAVLGLEFTSCAALFPRDTERRIQDGDSLSMVGGAPGDKTSSDMEKYGKVTRKLSAFFSGLAGLTNGKTSAEHKRLIDKVEKVSSSHND